MAALKKIIVVGQGIAGTMLSWFLNNTEINFLVIDEPRENTASATAGGLINPVTGRRVVTVWMDDILLPFAEKTYNQIGSFLGIKSISKMDIVDFFPNPFMKESFLKKLAQDAPYLNLISDADYMNEYFNYEFGAGTIRPAYIVYLSNLLPAWRNYLLTQKRILHQKFDFSKLIVTGNQVIYDGIVADKIIFCDGIQGASNPYFSLLPFALNKGEAIIIEAPGLPNHHIYKKSLTLTPLNDPGLFWVGTNYIWDFDNDAPSEEFRKSTENNLRSWLKLPFKIVDHKAAVRPATVERRPFVGLHPQYKSIGILNGMGTKGCSLAPYFAHQLLQHLLNSTAIEVEANVIRHSRILSRQKP